MTTAHVMTIAHTCFYSEIDSNRDCACFYRQSSTGKHGVCEQSSALFSRSPGQGHHVLRSIGVFSCDGRPGVLGEAARQ